MTRGNGQMWPTKKDVAATAGVSPATVTNVLTGRTRVREQTRRKVLAAVQELDYSPHGPAQALRSGHNRTLGFCVPFSTNLTLSQTLRGASQEAYAAGYVLSVCVMDYDVNLERDYLNAFAQQRVAAVIALPASSDPHPYLRLQSARIPVVFVDHRPPGIIADVVGYDYRAGIQMAVQHLIKCGRRRVALLAIDAARRPDAAGVDGYRAAYSGAGLAIDESLITLDVISIADAYNATHSLLLRGQPPDAFIAIGLLLMLGAMECLRRHGVRISQDVSFVGTSDTVWTPLVEPPLTVIQVPGDELGRRATAMALERVAQGGSPLPRARFVFPSV